MTTSTAPLDQPQIGQNHAQIGQVLEIPGIEHIGGFGKFNEIGQIGQMPQNSSLGPSQTYSGTVIRNKPLNKENENLENYSQVVGTYGVKEQQYFSGKNYNNKPLDYNGTHKLKTSIKDKNGRELKNSLLGSESVVSPISYHRGGYDAYENYQNYEGYTGQDQEGYGDTQGRSTFQRNPYH